MFKAGPDNTQAHMGFANAASPIKHQILEGVQSHPTHRHTWGLLTLLVQPNTKYWKVFKASPDNTQAHMEFGNAASPTKFQILKGVQSWS